MKEEALKLARYLDTGLFFDEQKCQDAIDMIRKLVAKIEELEEELRITEGTLQTTLTNQRLRTYDGKLG